MTQYRQLTFSDIQSRLIGDQCTKARMKLSDLDSC